MEDKNESYNITLTKDNTQILMEQMESSICKIRQKDGNIGIGYFCNLIYQNMKYKVLITKYKMIKEDTEIIEVTLNNDKIIRTINLNNKKLFKCKHYNIII